jgi:diguanylate cyclase (GGDEF)-like protein/PAS domain S-box-containing protein
MINTARRRFILFATFTYAVLALGWIFLSDSLLGAFTNVESILWLSTAKGVFFVVVTATMFFFALQSVPSAQTGGSETLLESLAAGFAPKQYPRWLMYVFAVVLPVITLLVRQSLNVGGGDRLMLILFMLPIILSALLGGLGPGLLSTVVAALGVDYFFISPTRSLRIAANLDLFQWFFLVLNGVAISVLSELLRQFLTRAETNRRLLNTVVSGTLDAVFVKDTRGHYLLANAAAAAYIGKPVSAILGRDDRDLFQSASALEVMGKDQAIMAGGHTQVHEERVTTQDGKSLVFLVTKGPIFDKEGRVTGLFGISHDITQRQQAAEALRASEERLRLAIDATSDGLWDWDVRSGVVYRSPHYYEMTGYSADECTNDLEFFRRLVLPEDLPHALECIEAHKQGRTSVIDFEFRMLIRGGGLKWIRAKGRAVERDALGAPLRIAGTISDITERKEFELAQKEAATVFSSTQEAIMVLSPAKLVTKVNPAFTRITGFDPQDVVGLSPRMLLSGRHDAPFYQEMWNSVHTNGFWRGEVWDQRKNGVGFTALLSVSVVLDSSGAVQHYVCVFSDISQLKEHEAELDRMAHFDPLTGLPNRRLLADRLAQAIIRTARTERSLALVLLDLDGFKAINDEWGHAAGDQLLMGVTESLKHVLRVDDTLAHLGGDEFVLLLSDISSREECVLILHRVLAAVGSPVQIADRLVSTTASLGVSLYPGDNADADTLLRHADQAMYIAKDAGKNRYHFFDPESDRKTQDHRKYLEVLRQAFVKKEFVLYYQPKVNLVSGEVFGVEALIRWQHPERGLLPPAEFLPHVNGSDLEVTLGEWVIHTALAQAEDWSLQGFKLSVSVNVSARHLLKPDFYEFLKDVLVQHPDACAGFFELEVLETAAIEDMAQAVTILQRCRTLGVHFALDDFGTGYSSLTYLRKLPVDMLKIDQSFVRDMLTDSDDMGIVEGVIRLAGAFNRQVIAEGVETPAHGRALVQLGCRLAQGYGIARPMPAGQLRVWSEQWQREMPWAAMADNAG